MKLAIMQPYFFPYLGYFQAIHAVDRYILYGNLNYIKEGWMHRNRILKKNARPFYIKAEIEDKSSFRKINEIRLDQRSEWRQKGLKSIHMNYRASPYYQDVFPLLESILSCPTDSLYELNFYGITCLCRYLDIKTEIVNQDARYADLEAKLASVNHAGAGPDARKAGLPAKVVRIIEICRLERADQFVNAIGGQALYHRDEFARFNIELKFVKTREIFYRQSSGTFVPDLSIIDVLMNCGKQGTRKLLELYELI